MKIEKLIAEINEQLYVKNHLIASETIDEAINRAINLTSAKLSAQISSVFLINKDGYLKRMSLVGYDKGKNMVANDWYSEERYIPGESFTGKIFSSTNSSYGEPQWSNNLEQSDINELSKKLYLEKFGSLKCAITVPLNGRHRTYGALEVINKISTNYIFKKRSVFTLKDVYWLSFLGINLSTVISHIRRQNEFKILSEFTKHLTETYTAESYPFEIYDKMCNLLISNETNYKVCILRVGSKNETLDVVARASDNLSWADRQDIPVKRGERLTGKVFESNAPIYLEDIQTQANNFMNIRWINDNNLKSYACLPLSYKNTVLGTLSLFTGYKYIFYDSDREFLSNIAQLIASFINNSGYLTELKETNKEKQEIFSEAKAISFDNSLLSALHEYKNELTEIKNNLLKSLESSIGKRNTIIESQIVYLEKQIIKYTTQLDKPVGIVDINLLIKALIKTFRQEIKENNITIEQKLNVDIPNLLLNESEFREVIYNIMSNAIKAVKYSKKKDKSITINTAFKEEEQIDFIVVEISDNGIGIRNEISNKIFEKKYTEFEEGTGMGLWLTKNILDQYGCKYKINSSVGKGTEFIIYIPQNRYKE